MTDRELMQQALEALDLLSRVPKAKRDYADRAIAALQERLAQPEQEPVAFVDPIWMQRPDLIIEQRLEIKKLFARVQVMDYVPLYTAPQPAPTIDKSAAIRIATALGWEPPREEQEQEPVAKWDASAPLVVTPHPAFQATLQTSKPWVGLTAAEFRKVVDGLEDLEDCWVALEHALKEKNT